MLAALAIAPSAAPAAGPPALKIAWRPSPNYTRANRPGSLIRKIVIHATQGGYFGSVSWLQNARAQASAHYVVSRTGAIAQLVRDTDIAWHAGNWAINRESIGIEHEGFTNVPSSFTDAEYRASARLAGFIARSHLLPIDRQHFIGHSEVPDPNHPGQFGGGDHHTDPGRYWDWSRYLGYVRTYARGSTPPTFAAPKAKPAPVAVVRTKPATPARPGAKPAGGATAVGPVFAFAGLQPGKGLSGFVPWQADVAGTGVARVEFLVDGVLRFTAGQAPFRYGGGDGALDTTQLANGAHVLAIRVVSTKGAVTGSSVKVGIMNTPFAVGAIAPANGAAVKGKVRLSAGVTGGLADHVDFVVDGRLVATQRSAPYETDWDTTKTANGSHTVTLRSVAQDGRVATTTLAVVVANPVATAPAPPKLTSISILGQSLADGQTVSGLVRWSADVGGRDVERVEFWVDGTMRWMDRGSPYVYNGNYGRWDTRAESNGQHVLTVRAVAVSGAEAKTSIVVGVGNSGPTGAALSTMAATTVPATPAAPATPLAVTLPLAPGSTVKGTVHVVASADGAPARVEFWVDGALRHTELSSPYEFDWDTTRLADGAHTLVARAIAGDRSATATTTVTVANAVAAPAPAAAPTVSLPLRDGQAVSGQLHLVAATTGTPTRVEFWLDGVLRHTELSAPYEWDWDTTREKAGAHALVVKAVGATGTGSASLSLVVANTTTTTTTAPTTTTTGTTTTTRTTTTTPTTTTTTTTTTTVPSAAPTLATGLTAGQTVAGVVHVAPTGVPDDVRRIEFWIDGAYRSSARWSPYAYDWDTRRYANGSHVVTVRAVGRHATIDTSTSVVVANP